MARGVSLLEAIAVTQVNLLKLGIIINGSFYSLYKKTYTDIYIFMSWNISELFSVYFQSAFINITLDLDRT